MFCAGRNSGPVGYNPNRVVAFHRTAGRALHAFRPANDVQRRQITNKFLGSPSPAVCWPDCVGLLLLSFLWIVSNVGMAAAQAKATCKRDAQGKARRLGFAAQRGAHAGLCGARSRDLSAQHCIEVEIVEFEGGDETGPTRPAGSPRTGPGYNKRNSDCAGVKGAADLGMAPRLPQAYMVSEEIKSAADLKGKRLSATGGGVGGLNWATVRFEYGRPHGK